MIRAQKPRRERISGKGQGLTRGYPGVVLLLVLVLVVLRIWLFMGTYIPERSSGWSVASKRASRDATLTNRIRTSTNCLVLVLVLVLEVLEELIVRLCMGTYIPERSSGWRVASKSASRDATITNRIRTSTNCLVLVLVLVQEVLEELIVWLFIGTYIPERSSGCSVASKRASRDAAVIYN